MNLAAVWDLPVLFLVENNQYAVTLSVERSSGPDQLSDRAAGYGMPGKTIDGQDVLGVYEEVSESVETIRAGNGPQLIEAETYRYLDHTVSLTGMFEYRSEGEIEQWRERDPVRSFRSQLLEAGGVSEQDLRAIDEEVTSEVEAAVTHMQESSFPPADATADNFYQDEDYPELYQPRWR